MEAVNEYVNKTDKMVHVQSGKKSPTYMNRCKHTVHRQKFKSQVGVQASYCCIIKGKLVNLNPKFGKLCYYVYLVVLNSTLTVSK